MKAGDRLTGADGREWVVLDASPLFGDQGPTRGSAAAPLESGRPEDNPEWWKVNTVVFLKARRVPKA